MDNFASSCFVLKKSAPIDEKLMMFQLKINTMILDEKSGQRLEFSS